MRNLVRSSWGFFLLPAMLTVVPCFAATTQPTSQAQNTSANPSEITAPLTTKTNSGYTSRWSVEGSVQAQSVAGPASPWVGVAGAYRIWDPISLGIRGYLPASKTVDNSTYSLQSYVRVRTIHGTYTDLFFESEFAVNFYDLIPYTSFGFAAGVLTRVGSGISVGILGGIEAAKVVVDSVGLENEDSYAIYPKIALIGNFNF